MLESWLLVGVVEMKIRPRLGEGEEEGGYWAVECGRRNGRRERERRRVVVVGGEGIGLRRCG